MRKIKILVLLVLAALGIAWSGSVAADRIYLDSSLVRMHVVAESDSLADQQEKLAVRDAVLEFLKPDMASIQTAQEANQELEKLLPQISETANRTLQQRNSTHRARVTLCREPFPVREYDTFRLPAGVYQSLRITIGSGAGHNWWCVVFPELCGPTNESDFSEAAQAGGFSDSLITAVTGEEVEIRFYFLDLLGRIANFLHRDSLPAVQ